jgi:hypothetical protein
MNKPSPQTVATMYKNFVCLLIIGRTKKEMQNKIITVAAQGTGLQKSCRSVL